ncbi:hypothetical protein LUZ63_013398 [Rhynchospora breviuscula]|uniref:Cystatin domain-containing protein n=1 Tax=Rhynchospora breviuscula TaxID=2022672 RepID=A0A9Q0C8G5_9POAL|nr:hypothetical protein LUZ63_013398 [Rhynchospora breviuscula]
MYTMASKHFAVLVILLLGATLTRGGAFVYPISNVGDEQIQSLGSFAVDEYDKRGESHLLFKMVFGGYVEYYGVYNGYTYHLDLMAVNCTQSGALGNYTAVVYQYTLNQKTTTWFGELKPKQT